LIAGNTGFTDTLGDFVFVAVDVSTIQVAVVVLKSILDSLSNFIRLR
jgi:hypothetical protein